MQKNHSTYRETNAQLYANSPHSLRGCLKSVTCHSKRNPSRSLPLNEVKGSRVNSVEREESLCSVAVRDASLRYRSVQHDILDFSNILSAHLKCNRQRRNFRRTDTPRSHSRNTAFLTQIRQQIPNHLNRFPQRQRPLTPIQLLR